MLHHFSERQRSHIGLPGLPILAALAEVAVALTLPSPLGVRFLQWGVVALFVALALTMRELSVQVDAQQMTFGFGFLRRRVRLSRIVGVRVVDSAALHLGLGVRSSPDGRMAWIAMRGPAVAVDVRRTGAGQPTTYIISTSRPHDLAAALQSGQASRTLDGS